MDSCLIYDANMHEEALDTTVYLGKEEAWAMRQKTELTDEEILEFAAQLEDCLESQNPTTMDVDEEEEEEEDILSTSIYEEEQISGGNYSGNEMEVDEGDWDELLALEETGERVDWDEVFSLVLQAAVGTVAGRGASEEIVGSRLKRSVKERIEKDSMCVVCLDRYDIGDEVGKLDCGHEYHVGCIKSWLLIKNECAICRRTGVLVGLQICVNKLSSRLNQHQQEDVRQCGRD